MGETIVMSLSVRKTLMHYILHTLQVENNGTEYLKLQT